MTDRNEKNLQSDGIEPSAHDSPVPSVVFHNAKCTLRLNRTVHSQQCAMDTVQIIQHLPVHRGQLLVDSHRSVLRRLFAFVCIGAAAAILAFKYFLLPSVFVSLYVLSITEGALGRRFPVHQIYVAHVDLAIVFQLPQRAVSIVRKCEQHRFQHIDRIVPVSSCDVFRNVLQVLA